MIMIIIIIEIPLSKQCNLTRQSTDYVCVCVCVLVQFNGTVLKGIVHLHFKFSGLIQL